MCVCVCVCWYTITKDRYIERHRSCMKYTHPFPSTYSPTRLPNQKKEIEKERKKIEILTWAAVLRDRPSTSAANDMLGSLFPFLGCICSSFFFARLSSRSTIDIIWWLRFVQCFFNIYIYIYICMYVCKFKIKIDTSSCVDWLFDLIE